MKNEILDDIFKDDFRNLLQKDEKVVWDGRPAITSFTKWSFILGVVVVILMVLTFAFRGIELINFIYPAALAVLMILRLWRSQKVRYLITNQRILFQLWEKPKSNFLGRSKKVVRAIPLEEIKYISVRESEKNHGAILIQPKNKNFHFNSKNLKTGEDRFKPSLEMIDKVEEVAAYIRTGMQKRIE